MKTVKKVINGVEYTAVYKGLDFAMKCSKECTVKGTQFCSEYKLATVVFDEVIINPKVSIDDFNNIKEFYAVLDFGKSVLFGEFERKKSRGQLKREVYDEWGAWRLICSDMGNFDFNTVFNEMTPQEIEKANIALDIISEQIKKESKRKH